MSRLHVVLAVGAVLGGVGSASAEQIVLARAAKPAATIVLPVGAEGRPVEAAEDLQRYVQKVCGVSLPIARDGKHVPGVGLYIGPCEPSREDDPPAASLNPESYAIRVRDGSVFFAGRYPTPTYFAVASFIENTLGVRWFAPGDTWEYVPTGQKGELTVDVHESVKEPDTSPRVWSGHNFSPDYDRWDLHNKAVMGEKVPRRNFQNNLHRIFPPSKYAKPHPEYYPLVEGRRWIPPDDEYRYWRPCESNPEVLRLTVEATRKFFDENPGADSFSVGMDDIAHLCGCPNCRAMDAHPDSYEKREFSDRHYKFVNAVAREVAKTHPDRYIGTLIYAIARKPPETVPRLEDNVFGYITEVGARWCEPGRREENNALTREWALRCKHLSRYEYFGLGTFTPRYYPHFVAEGLKLDKSLGFDGMYVELNTFLPHTAPMVWAMAKLQWDASLEVDALLGEFCTNMYGPAAPVMAHYYDHLERSWNELGTARGDWEHRDIRIQARAISAEAVGRGMALLDEAMAAAGSDVVRRRIDVVRSGLRYAGYAIRENAISEGLMAAQVGSAADARNVAESVRRLVDLSAEREPFWAAARERQDLLGENIRGLAGKGYLMVGRATDLEHGGLLASIRLLDWYGEHDSAAVPGLVRELTGDGKSALADAVRGLAWVREHRQQNLVKNTGFERKTAGRGADGLPATLPADWTIYDSSTRSRFAHEEKAGRNGSAAVRLQHAKSGSVYMQVHRVNPGERYLCVAYARSEPARTNPNAYVSVRFRTASGAWHPRKDLEPQVHLAPGPGWQPIAVVATVPEGAGGLVLMVGAKSQPSETTVWFDDVGLYRLP